MPTIREEAESGNGPLYALVLAAGAGSRFGGAKLHAPFEGGRLLDATIRAALTAPVAGVIVVVQPGQELASPFSDPRLRLAACADWAEGMAASLRCGIAALPGDAAGAFVFLGDMPRIPGAILKPLAEAVLSGAPAALPVWEGRDGHPVVFSARLFPDLLALTEDRGARGVVSTLGDHVVRIAAADAGVLIDVDRPEDLERLQQHSRLPPA